jgi:hypothetical protein
VLLVGVLTSYLSWSWIFFVNVLVGAAVIALSSRLLADRATTKRATRTQPACRSIITGHPDGHREASNPATVAIPTSLRGAENEEVHHTTRLEPSINRKETS